MTKKSQLKANGELSGEMTENRQAMQYSNAELTPLARNLRTSDTLGTTPQQKINFQVTPNSQAIPPKTFYGKVIQTFASKLVALGVIEWRSWELADGRKGWGLFFDSAKWMVDPMTKELTPTNAEAK